MTTFKKKFNFITILCSVAVIAICLTVFIGWQSDIEALKSVLPGMPVMTPLTALLLLLFSSGTLLRDRHSRDKGNNLQKTAGLLLTIAGLCIVLWVSIQYIFRLPASIEVLMFKEKLHRYGAAFIGRPSPHTVVTGIITGVALLYAYSNTKRNILISVVLASVILIIPWLALFGYITTSIPLFALQEDYKTGISLLTSVCYVLLSV